MNWRNWSPIVQSLTPIYHPYTRKKPNLQHGDPWPNQKAPIENPISQTKDPVDEQPHNLINELNELLTENQDNIQDDQDSLLADLNVGNLEEFLQSFSTEKFPEIQSKTSLKVSDDNTIEKMVVLNDELQKSRTKDIKEVQKSMQRLY